ncbi:MAG: Re/Si-specific NAD(P)(+) transhydrogenase subunit alpha [Streptosporangiaceae bacterium]
MRVAVPSETLEDERRVALVPEIVPRLVDAGHDVVVEAGAGRAAYADDDAYRDAGASVEDADATGGITADADVVLTVNPLAPARVASLKPGTITISFLPPAAELDTIRACRDARVTAFSLDLVPRISRAQSMDALSSQALVAGYRAALIAATRLPRFFPLFMTAAGTVPPARVFVLGAGVAGLQAIATARRLGAAVEAYDVRSAAAEEVRSLGAKFVELSLESQEGAGGYAREQSDDFLARQREMTGDRVAASDAVITTAAVPGRRAPVLVTREMVERMRAGSVIVDLAAKTGGNCELSRPGEEIDHEAVIVHGARNLPSQLPVHASRLYAQNIATLLLLMTKEGTVVLDFEDEVVAGSCVTHDGEVRHEATRALLEGDGR